MPIFTIIHGPIIHGFKTVRGSSDAKRRGLVVFAVALSCQIFLACAARPGASHETVGRAAYLPPVWASKRPVFETDPLETIVPALRRCLMHRDGAKGRDAEAIVSASLSLDQSGNVRGLEMEGLLPAANREEFACLSGWLGGAHFHAARNAIGSTVVLRFPLWQNDRQPPPLLQNGPVLRDLVPSKRISGFRRANPILRDSIVAMWPRLKQCLTPDSLWVNNPEEDVVLHWLIDATGDTAAIWIETATDKQPARACVRKELKRMHFPTPGPGRVGIASLTWLHPASRNRESAKRLEPEPSSAEEPRLSTYVETFALGERGSRGAAPNTLYSCPVDAPRRPCAPSSTGGSAPAADLKESAAYLKENAAFVEEAIGPSSDVRECFHRPDATLAEVRGNVWLAVSLCTDGTVDRAEFLPTSDLALDEVACCVKTEVSLWQWPRTKKMSTRLSLPIADPTKGE